MEKKHKWRFILQNLSEEDKKGEFVRGDEEGGYYMDVYYTDAEIADMKEKWPEVEFKCL